MGSGRMGAVMEPVDPIDDFLTTRGTVQQNVTLRVYTPSRDQDGTDPWEPAIAIRGSHGTERTTGGRSEGDTATTVTTWWITSKTSADPILQRPTLLSKIGACGKVWLILEADPNPRNGRLFKCECQLSPAG